ncbi:putative nucleic acid-binding protein [Kineosphaera limosa]|uniref:Ribonuclease VapC n=1 Tax=Kineosphaera limosa NBRC 100340 TaxID=1184609 RepID=K6VDF9_9MICO|nr:type II toxin-antitoxin system VapC family toxin [Kineosphaera limosa]NYE02802.1 putative nucleic acid-binding protein [Kineosphaera limosa]GAB94233.1 hypothetical protein KILIM_004_00220 [Kineosphaera limosa NBRC 100340]
MSADLVCDASALVALLLDGGPDGAWASRTLAGANLATAAVCRFEAGNIIRRHEAAGLIGSDQAALAHTDLLDLALTEWPYETLAERAWALRPNLTSYDASYVALAELLEVPLVTLDRRVGRASGQACTVLTPEQGA